MPFAEINGAKIYYELHGEGHPLILIAGYTCDHLFWLPVISELRKHFQVLSFDNRAVGQTQDENQAISVDIMATDTMLLANHLGLLNPHIVGHSMGGTVAQTIAAKYPNNISKLALLATAAKWRPTMVSALKSLLALREKNVNLDLILDAVLPWIFGQAFIQDPRRVQLFKQGVINNPYPQSLADQRRQFNVLEPFDGLMQLRKIVAPTLVIYGEEDLISLPQEAAFLVAHIPDALSLKLPCAHGMISEVPGDVIRTLTSFLH